MVRCCALPTYADVRNSMISTTTCGLLFHFALNRVPNPTGPSCDLLDRLDTGIPFELIAVVGEVIECLLLCAADRHRVADKQTSSPPVRLLEAPLVIPLVLSVMSTSVKGEKKQPSLLGEGHPGGESSTLRRNPSLIDGYASTTMEAGGRPIGRGSPNRLLHLWHQRPKLLCEAMEVAGAGGPRTLSRWVSVHG